MQNEKLISALKDAIAIADSYERNRELIIRALNKAGLPSTFLQGWEAKFERIRKAVED